MTLKRHTVHVKHLTTTTTAYYAVAPPAHPTDTLPPLLIALHGWGQNCKKMLRDLAPMAEEDILVAAPQAPHPFYLDMESGKVGFHWLTRYERDQAVADTNTFLLRLLETLRETHPFDERRVYLLGFSQGCSMAWRFCASGLIAPAGMIACGADLPPDVAEKLPHLPPFPVLLVHGDEDPIITIKKMHEAQATLSTHHFPHTTHEFHGGHDIPPEVAQAIAQWIAAH